ncbi:GumC family protein [Thalassobellus citreus]|uniref:GumC family protein n=1 Tax=Thalassobellus citreus TaxID=3367752 RepID=UPI0037ADD628
MKRINTKMFNTEQEELNIIKDINKYLNYWPWFLITMVVSLLISFFYLRYTNKVYLSNAKIQVLDKSKGIELNTSSYLFNRSNVNLENEVELLISYPIIEQVVVKNKLNISFFEKGTIQVLELASLPFKFKVLIDVDSITSKMAYNIVVNSTGFDIIDINADKFIQIAGYSTNGNKLNLPFEIIETAKNMKHFVGHTYQIKFVAKENVINQLKSSIKIKQVGDYSNVLKLSLQGKNKLKLESTLNALIEAYKLDGIKDRQLVSKRTVEFVDDRLLSLFGELDSIEDKKKKFKQQNTFIDIQEQVVENINKITLSDASLFEIHNQIFLANSLKDQLISNFDEIHLLPVNLGFNNSELDKFIGNYNAKVLEYSKYKKAGGVNNPLIKNIEEQLNSIKNNLENSLKVYIQDLKFRQNQFKEKHKEISEETSIIPLNEKVLRSIERQQNIKESLYLLLLQKREEAAINLSVTESSVKVVEYAKANTSPIAPKPFVIYSIAILISILGPFGGLYLVFALDTKIRLVEDLENLIPEIPIVAEIPSIKGVTSEADMLLTPNENNVQNEVFRILSSNINLINPSLINKNQGKVIFSTSSIKGEGKTYVSINLAITLSSFNKRVLLVGGDLRNPQIHNYIGCDKNQEGLSNYLYNEHFSWEDSIIKPFDNNTNFDVLQGGPIPPNAQQLLSNGKFGDLIDKAKLSYDYIIVDTAPTILVSDTFLISKYADVITYVVRSNYSDKKIILHLKKLYKTEKLKNIGLVVNGLNANKSNQYNYGYGYGYGAN